VILPVQWQQQPNEVWCWATVGSMISVYYKAQFDVGTACTPCQVATQTLPVPDCCLPDPPDACVQPFDLQRALAAIQHLGSSLPSDSGFDLVVGEIGAGRPLCAMIQFNGGPLHYVIVNGFDQASQQITVVNSAGSPQSLPMPFASFLANDKFSLSQWILTV